MILKEHCAYPLEILNESGLNRFLSKHTSDGFIMVSAERIENTEKENKENTKELESLISKIGYSYIPVTGGYKDLNDPNAEESVEQSFIIPITKRNGKKHLQRSCLLLEKKYQIFITKILFYTLMVGKSVIMTEMENCLLVRGMILLLMI